MEERDSSFKVEKEELEKNVAALKQRLLEAETTRETLESKCKGLQRQMAQMDTQTKQALGMARGVDETIGRGMCGFETARERELFVDLEATKIALGEASKTLKMYKEEKVRFIDTIKKMGDDATSDGNNKETLAQTLIEKEELLTRLGHDLAEERENNEMLSIRVEQLSVKNEALEERLHAGDVDTVSLDSSRLRVDQAISMSASYKEQIMRLERETQKRSIQVKELENLSKLKDGLLEMMKEKKDAVLEENSTLKSYADNMLDQFKAVSNQLVEKNDQLIGMAMKVDAMKRSLSEAEEKFSVQKQNMVQLNTRRFKLQSETEKLQEELRLLRQQVATREGGMHARYDENGMAPPLLFANSSGDVEAAQLTVEAEAEAEAEEGLWVDVLRKNLLDVSLGRARDMEKRLECMYTVMVPSKEDVAFYGLKRRHERRKEFLNHVNTIVDWDIQQNYDDEGGEDVMTVSEDYCCNLAAVPPPPNSHLTFATLSDLFRCNKFSSNDINDFIP